MKLGNITYDIKLNSTILEFRVCCSGLGVLGVEPGV